MYMMTIFKNRTASWERGVSVMSLCSYWGFDIRTTFLCGVWGKHGKSGLTSLVLLPEKVFEGLYVKEIVQREDGEWKEWKKPGLCKPVRLSEGWEIVRGGQVCSRAPDTHSPGFTPTSLSPACAMTCSAKLYGSLTDPWLRLPVEYTTLCLRGLKGSLRTLERPSSRHQGLGRLHNQVFAQEVHPQTTKLASASPSSLCQTSFDN